MGCDIEYDPKREAEFQRNQYQKDQDRRQKELDYARRIHESLRNLSYEKLPQAELKPAVEKMIVRTQRISDILPQLEGVGIKDSLGRSWEVSWNKSEKSGEVYLVGMRRSYAGVQEGHIFSLIEHSGIKDASIQYVNWSMIDCMQHDNLWAVVPTEKRFDDLFVPLEKALGITVSV